MHGYLRYAAPHVVNGLGLLTMFVATILALCAAVLHAAWNISVKQTGDRFLAIWAQFFFAGLISTTALVVWFVVDGPPNIAWTWSIASGLGHLPYAILLATAYDRSDFSVTYPIARGGGALSAAVLAMMILKHDALTPLAMGGIAIVLFGLWVLTSGQAFHHLSPALGVSATIGIYSVVDAYGARNSNSVAFALSVFISGAITITVWALATRRQQLLSFLAASWKTFLAAGAMSLASYSLVVFAFTRAPVGYVATLREASVIIAAFAGWRMLGEEGHRRRITAATIVVTGLVVLIVGS